MSVDPPYKVLLVGHSYVYWLRSFVETTLPGSGFGDFVVDGSSCDVAYNGVRGATVNTFLDADMFARIIAARPHVVCLCLGGNDFPASTPVMIALDIFRLARKLLASGVQCVCVYRSGVSSAPLAHCYICGWCFPRTGAELLP